MASYFDNSSGKKNILSLYVSGWRADQARSKWETLGQHQAQYKRTSQTDLLLVKKAFLWTYVVRLEAFLTFLHHVLHNPYRLFSFLFCFMEFLPALPPLGRYATPKKEVENADFIRLLGQSLTNDLATIFAVCGMLLACILYRATIQFGILSLIITSWSLMRPRKKRLKIPTSVACQLGQSLFNDLAIIYAVATWLVTCVIGRAWNTRLLGQSLTKLAIIYAVAI